MHGPDKGNYGNEAIYFKADKPSLIARNRLSQPPFHVLASFEELAPAKTKPVFRMLFENSKECYDQEFALSKNEEDFDKLELSWIE